jgi:hypothetical protein
MSEWIEFSQPTPEFNPLFTLFAPAGSYSRVAYLTDATPTNKALLVDDWAGKTHLFSWVSGVLPAAKSQVDLTTNMLIPTQKWAPARGVYVSPADAQFIGAPSNVGPLNAQQAIPGTFPF